LTLEQLHAARAERWRQLGVPVLTLEDAAQWVESMGLCFFVPRRGQFHAPAPSFVEAFIGMSLARPGMTEIHEAFLLAVRLFNSGGAVPLNLLGTVSEQPDFFVSPEALPYVFSLRGDRNWKRGPGKGSQLAADIWKLLKKDGALTALELQDKLGRGVSEAAVLRALTELWGAMYVVPVYSESAPTTWSLLEETNQKAMQMGGGAGQTTALSALISLYLDSVIVASAEEIETFLSPLAPRSRIREVARGLLATRQLSTLTLGTQSLLYITGGLPEFPAVEALVEAAPEPAALSASPATEHPRKAFTPRPKQRKGPRPERGGEKREFRGKPRPQGGLHAPRRDGGAERPAWKRGEDRPETGQRREWKPRTDHKEGGRPFRKTGDFDKKKPFKREERPFRKRSSEQEGEERKRPGSEGSDFRSESRPGKFGSKFSGRSGGSLAPKSATRFSPRSGAKSGSKFGGKSGPKSGRFGAKQGGKFGPRSGPRPGGRKFPPKRKDDSGE